MRNINFLRGAAVALVAVFSISAAQAASITGSLNFGGEADPTGGSDLADATGLSFPTGLVVTDMTGSFSAAGIEFSDAGSIADFTFSPSSALDLISVDGFSYALASVTVVDQSTNFLVLSGVGTLSGNGFDPTAYLISLSVDTAGGNFAYSGTLAAVPVPGALVLLMSALAALGLRRRD